MFNEILKLASELQPKTVERRRDFHRHAEVAWTEFRTASIVAETLTSLGYKVQVGEEVIDARAMMDVPPAEVLAKHVERALAQGANPAWVEKMAGGLTGVVGTLEFAKPGPTVALRFDMDANDALEATDENHRPYRERFASVNPGAMHACGHDGHTAVGLTVAEILARLAPNLAGKVKLIFQPAEEGVRGAKAMTMKGVVDDVEYLLGMHLGLPLKLGQLACETIGFLATTKFDAEFTGVAAHAGAAPENGRNALLAAATAALNLHAIPRHSQGASRINVGVMQAGTGRNVVPANALIKVETRGVTSQINQFIYDQAIRIIKAAADMYGVEVKITEAGSAPSGSNTPELVKRLEEVAKRLGIFEEFVTGDLGGSEDCTYFMERVQQRGGQAAYTIVGTETAAGHHNFRFDFNEEALFKAAAFLAAAAADLLTEKCGE